MHLIIYLHSTDSYLQNVHTDEIPSECTCKFTHHVHLKHLQTLIVLLLPINTCTLTNFVIIIVLVPEIGFTVSSGSVSESVGNYMVTIRSSVAGEASSGLVEIYTLPGEPEVGYATGKLL